MLMIKESQHCVQKQVKPATVLTLGGHTVTIIRKKQAFNSTGSMVGIAWVTVCWGVMVCISVGQPDGGGSFPSDSHTCRTAHCYMGSQYSQSARILYRIYASMQNCDAVLLGK
jgi:hypothetical protein